MRHNHRLRIVILLAISLIAIIVLSSIRGLDNTDALYSVTEKQWQEAFGDAAYIQTIYRNVTIEIGSGDAQEKMILATDNGGLLLDDQINQSKYICVSAENGFVTYIWENANQVWKEHTGKADSVDAILNTYLPQYVDTAMTGLQKEFKNAIYEPEEHGYTIKLQKEASSGEESETMHCRIFFENGKLIRLETEIISDQVLTVCLYDIGYTKVVAPTEDETRK